MIPAGHRYRAPLAWVALPFLCGLLLARQGLAFPLGGTLVLSALFLVCSFGLLNDERWLWGLFLCVSMTLAGAASYSLHRPELPDWDVLPPREASLVLRCERLYSSSDPSKISGLAVVVGAERHLDDLQGRTVYFHLAAAKRVRILRSSVFRAAGVLERVPRAQSGQGFDRYLADSGVDFRFSRGSVKEERTPARSYYSWCESALRRMRAILGVGIERDRPGLAGVFRAMLLGQQREMSEDRIRLYRTTGTMHLFSISGMHITVIAVAIHGLLSLFRLPRAALFVLSLTAVWLYVDVTGRAPSAVRAFIMVALVETAFFVRRPVNPLAALMLSTLVILVWDPLQVFGASFQMSYGIVAALILLGSPLGESIFEATEPFRGLPSVSRSRIQNSMAQGWRWLVLAVSAGLAASTVGTLTGLYFFQSFAPGSLLLNLALIPLSGYVLLSGLLSLLCGFLYFDAGAYLFNHAGALLLLAMEFLARSAERLPGMSGQGSFVSDWFGGFSVVVLIGLCLWGYSCRWKGRFCRLWLPFAFVVLVVAVGVNFASS